MYGLTESSGVCIYQKPLNAKLGSIGTLVLDTYAKVSCLATRQPLSAYAVGELCFKGDCIMKGYINNDKATNEAIDSDGYLYSGDLGYYDEDKCFYIVDRIKDIIKYKGFQVSPAELENVILKHPCVKDCGVVSVSDKKAGELPLAFVVLHEGKSVSENEIVDYVAERISVQKRLYGGVRFLEKIPRNSIGKIQRSELRKLLKSFIQ